MNSPDATSLQVHPLRDQPQHLALTAGELVQFRAELRHRLNASTGIP
jgi:hypothetical protein